MAFSGKSGEQPGPICADKCSAQECWAYSAAAGPPLRPGENKRKKGAAIEAGTTSGEQGVAHTATKYPFPVYESGQTVDR